MSILYTNFFMIIETKNNVLCDFYNRFLIVT